jgi:hypothetical protein
MSKCEARTSERGRDVNTSIVDCEWPRRCAGVDRRFLPFPTAKNAMHVRAYVGTGLRRHVCVASAWKDAQADFGCSAIDDGRMETSQRLPGRVVDLSMHEDLSVRRVVSSLHAICSESDSNVRKKEHALMDDRR